MTNVMEIAYVSQRKLEIISLFRLGMIQDVFQMWMIGLKSYSGVMKQKKRRN